VNCYLLAFYSEAPGQGRVSFTGMSGILLIYHSLASVADLHLVSWRNSSAIVVLAHRLADGIASISNMPKQFSQLLSIVQLKKHGKSFVLS
jgi:hypothetical protein